MDFTFLSTRRAICSRSATTSPTAGATPASTTCWPPRRASAASSPSPRASLPQEHWFSLGRLLTAAGRAHGAGLLERLDVRIPDAAAGHAHLRQHAARPYLSAAVVRGRSITARARVPWGISESGYNLIDAHLNYQYRAFGVPGLGLKRGLAEDLVDRALRHRHGPDGRTAKPPVENLERLASDGVQGPLRLLRSHRLHAVAPAARPEPASPSGRSWRIIEGMSLLSLAYLLLDRPMQRRFLADPSFKADRLAAAGTRAQAPRRSIRTPPKLRGHDSRSAASRNARCASSPTPDTPAPGSASAFQRPLSRRCQQRRRRLQPLAGSGRHPLARRSDARLLGHVLLSPRCRQAAILVGDLSADAEHAATLRGDLHAGPRRIPPPATATSKRTRKSASRPRTMSSCGASRSPIVRAAPRTIEVTSYAEVVLATPAADAAHPAFSNLFVQTELFAHRQAILCTRRPRSAGEAARPGCCI